MQSTYRIPEANFADLSKKLARLAKRAEKLDQAINITDVDIEDVIDEKKGTSRRFYNITIDGETPSLNGWTFNGVVAHLGDGEGNLIKTVPGRDIPTEYRDGEATCDHCQTNRNRKETFVVEHEDGTIKRVGRNCLADFLGHQDPHVVAKWAEILMVMSQVCEAYEEGMGGYGNSDWFGLDVYLGVVAAYIREFGWMSRTNARKEEGCVATADWAARWCTNTLNKKLGDLIIECVTQKDRDLGQTALEWARNLDGDLNDYLHNCKVISGQEVVHRDNIGIAASIVSSYQREVTRNAERQAEAKRHANSQHLGQLGDRMDTVAYFVSQRSYDSMFGLTYMRKFHDINDNVIIWWGSGNFFDYQADMDVEPGCWCHIRFTIKEHDEYNDVLQTKVTRCSFEGPVSEEDIERHNAGDIDIIRKVQLKGKTVHGVSFDGALCGSKSKLVSADDNEITCKNCLRSLDKMKKAAEKAKAKAEAQAKKEATDATMTEFVMTIAEANGIHAENVLDKPKKKRTKRAKGSLLDNADRQAEFLTKYPWVKEDSFVAGGKGVQITVVCQRCGVETVRNTQDAFQSKHCPDCKKAIKKEKRNKK